MLTVRYGEASQARIVLVGGAVQMSKPAPGWTRQAIVTPGPGGGGAGAAPAPGPATTEPDATSASAVATAALDLILISPPLLPSRPGRALRTGAAVALGRRRPSPSRTSACRPGRRTSACPCRPASRSR